VTSCQVAAAGCLHSFESNRFLIEGTGACGFLAQTRITIRNLWTSSTNRQKANEILSFQLYQTGHPDRRTERNP
jgi:hypothetical protein